jgi:hypothetical protein
VDCGRLCDVNKRNVRSHRKTPTSNQRQPHTRVGEGALWPAPLHNVQQDRASDVLIAMFGTQCCNVHPYGWLISSTYVTPDHPQIGGRSVGVCACCSRVPLGIHSTHPSPLLTSRRDRESRTRACMALAGDPCLMGHCVVLGCVATSVPRS